MTSVGPARRAGGLARGGSGSFITSAGPNRFKSAPHSEFDSFAGRLAGWLALARFCLLRSAAAAVEMLSPLTNQTDRPLHARAPNELTTHAASERARARRIDGSALGPEKNLADEILRVNLSGSCSFGAESKRFTQASCPDVD